MDYCVTVSHVTNLVYIVISESLSVHVSGRLALFLPVDDATQVMVSKLIRTSLVPLTQVDGDLPIAIHIEVCKQNKTIYHA